MEKGGWTMTELERPRSYKDERDEMIDRETNGAALLAACGRAMKRSEEK